jgi:hypothetical protein
LTAIASRYTKRADAASQLEVRMKVSIGDPLSGQWHTPSQLVPNGPHINDRFSCRSDITAGGHHFPGWRKKKRPVTAVIAQ